MTSQQWALCDGATPEEVEALLREEHRQKTLTCRLRVIDWSARFSKVSDRIWSMVLPGPQGECGVVRLDRFECDPEAPSLCDFVSEKRVMDPEANSAIGSCADLEERPFRYSWRPGAKFLTCDRVDF